MCGGLIAAVYNVVLECIGLSRAHQTTTGKALMAIFLPLIVCCGVAIILGIVLGGFGAFLNKH
jgi:phosphotransferase system  glucose/maltose/N-acetylglucosamine-specific IIC component